MGNLHCIPLPPEQHFTMERLETVADLKLSGATWILKSQRHQAHLPRWENQKLQHLGGMISLFFFLHPEKQLNCGRNVSVVILQLNEINRPDGKMRWRWAHTVSWEHKGHMKPAAGKPRACLEDLGAPFVVMTMNSQVRKHPLNFLQPLWMRFQEHLVTEPQEAKCLLSWTVISGSPAPPHLPGCL